MQAMSKGKRGEYRYRPAWWLRNAHLQTLWGKFVRPYPKIETEAERVVCPDGDAIELRHLQGEEGAPRVLLLHGLEGRARSHYVGGILAEAKARGWGATLMLFRGCGSVPNLARRFYHSGETTDVGFVFSHLSAKWPNTKWLSIGVSLGGNVLLKWLGERGSRGKADLLGAAAVSTPFDLDAGARHIARGFSRVYDRHFVRSLRSKAIAKLARYPNLFDRTKLERARTIYEFDDVVTGPVHGFAGARDYYAKSSSMHFLPMIRVPTLLLSSRDDPFLPASVLSKVAKIARANPRIAVEFHEAGGHVGFIAGAVPLRPFYYAEWRVFRFFDETLEAG
jgi:predicted alpha/beta-fold hydrolase